MKICLLLPRLAGGGAERVALHLANGFRDRGHEVELALFRAEGDYLDQVPAEVPITELGADSVWGRAAAVAGHLRSARPDVMVAFMAHANIPAGLARAMIPKRVAPLVIGTEHGYWGRALEWKSGRPRHHLYNRTIRFAYRQLDGVIGVSDGIVERLTRMGMVNAGRVVALPNPVEIPDAHHADHDPARHHPWPVTLLTVGRLHPTKDQATALQVVARLRHDLDLGLLVLGQGPEQDRLVELARSLGIEHRVRFEGFVDPWPYYRAADAFLLTSVAEGQPLVLIEALAHGLPVVSTDCRTGPAEILAGGTFGRLAPVGDVEVLADSVVASLADEDQDRERLRARAAEFSVDAVVDRYLEFVAGLQGSRGVMTRVESAP